MQTDLTQLLALNAALLAALEDTLRELVAPTIVKWTVIEDAREVVARALAFTYR
jgi:hypothetical protein